MFKLLYDTYGFDAHAKRNVITCTERTYGEYTEAKQAFDRMCKRWPKSRIELVKVQPSTDTMLGILFGAPLGAGFSSAERSMNIRRSWVERPKHVHKTKFIIKLQK